MNLKDYITKKYGSQRNFNKEVKKMRKENPAEDLSLLILEWTLRHKLTLKKAQRLINKLLEQEFVD